MKKISAIILSMTLSMMIVALSAGVALVYCNHSGTTSLALTSASESCTDREYEACCKQSKAVHVSAPDCMSVKVLKLAPWVSVPHLVFSFHTQPQAVAPFLLSLCGQGLPSPVVTAAAKRLGRGFRSPPRTRLRMLRVWRI